VSGGPASKKISHRSRLFEQGQSQPETHMNIIPRLRWTRSPKHWEAVAGPIRLGFALEPTVLRDSELTHRSLTQIHSPVIIADVTYGGIETQGDGLLTHSSQTCLWIKTADCVPIFVLHPHSLALLHAGWRGLRGGLIQALAAKLSLRDCLFVLGPGISAKHYPVGEDVFGPWIEASPWVAKAFLLCDHAAGRRMLDLKLAIRLLLQDADSQISEDQIQDVPICTFSSPQWPSYRRSHPLQDRIWNYIYRK
jgi:copper oxidase (laccase) domain-containing protein